MKMKFLIMSAFFAFVVCVNAQNIKFTEYDLPNGLHVILHQNKKAPVVVTSVLYHVGGKDEKPGRTGFAHFFEHLLFEGTPNIKRSTWFKIVSSNGGRNNANTTQDRTYYYEVFPSNQLELGLYLESERMLHPIISQEGVDTQREVVKEEKRTRIDNAQYGKIVYFEDVQRKLFQEHPYKNSVIGSLEDLNAAKLSEFQDFFNEFYIPSNATLVVAGDIEIEPTKKLVAKYFGEIKKAKKDVVRKKYNESLLKNQVIDTIYDTNITIPALVLMYKTPAAGTRESLVMNLISTYLSGGASGKIRKALVDTKKLAIAAGSFNRQMEDFGVFLNFALPSGKTTLDEMLPTFEEEIQKIRTNEISDKDFKKIMNIVENQNIDANDDLEGVAYNLAEGWAYFRNTNKLNTVLKEMKTITKAEIKAVANKYLGRNQRLILYYLPEKK